MRCAALVVFVIALATSSGCGELTGAAELGDGALPFDAAPPRDTAPRPDTGPRPDGATDATVSDEPALAGDYLNERIAPTRGVFRLDRASAPDNPMIVVVSHKDESTIRCDAFASTPWALPAGAVLHRITLGGKGVRLYTVGASDPIDAVVVGRMAVGELDDQKAKKGTVTVTLFDISDTKAWLDVSFDHVDDDSDVVFEQRVTGYLEAAACSVP